ncbi:MAG: carboxypeptidase-like regulatory domain-containing protein, partial [Bacteroidales bacterium]|nr:carboxypeptidase-like regulatory domain-containing protein [Bacteroidales bacterium]
MLSKLINTIFVIIILACTGASVKAQKIGPGDLVLLHGVVMDASSLQGLPNVHYIVNNDYGGISGTDGKFSMFLERMDTIVFSYLGYQNVTFILSDTLRGDKFVAGIFLKSDTLSIGEVIVFPRLGDLRSEFRSTTGQISPELVNARHNLEILTYQGLNTSAPLDDPQANYDILKRKQIINAYEKGAIPSDKMIELNFISIIPAGIYLIVNGLPEKPEPP